MKPLAERVALVTGASSGIGAAVARALAGAGVRVALSARRADRLAALAQELGADRCLALPGDICDEGFARAAVERTAAHFGGIDILVNSAGTIQHTGFDACDTQEWRETFALNLFAPLYTSVAALGHMAAAGGGDIVQISSTSARRAVAPFASYAASKAALNSLSFSLREEAGKVGVRVCVVEPGATHTEIASHINNPAMAEAMRAHTTKPDALAAEDVAAMVLAVVSLPPRANVQELLVRPTSDVSSF